MTRLVVAVAFASLCLGTNTALAQDHSLALTIKLDELVEQLPDGRYHVRKTAIDAQGNVLGQPLRDGHICIKTVGQIGQVVADYGSTFDLSVLAWKAVGAKCKTAFRGDDTSANHETVCAATPTMAPPSRWNVLEADASCKFAYTETSRQRTCSDANGSVVAVAAKGADAVKGDTSNHYLTGAILVPGKSLRLHLREFDTSVLATRFVAGHAVDITKAATPCEAADRPATSVTD
jgi:hypothetical protein